MSLLEVSGVRISFAGLVALDDVGFTVEPDVIYGIIGPNGAGKTTLLNCLSRIYTPDAGRIRYDGRDVLGLPVHRMARAGICRTFQNLELAREETVRENVLVGALHRHRSSFFAEVLALPAARTRTRAARMEVDGLLDSLGLAQFAETPVASLPLATLKMVELARALAGSPRLLLLDEPAAGMNAVESRTLADTIRRLRVDRGLTVILVEHDMPLVMNVCDRILALDHGVAICEGTPDRVRNDPDVIKAYLGEEDDGA